MAFVCGGAIGTLSSGHARRTRSGVCGLRAGVRVGDDVSKAIPANGRVLVRVNRAESKTAGGLLLTNESKRPRCGVIVALPNTTPSQKPSAVDEFEVGDNVMWPNEYVAETVQDEEERIVSLKATNISAKW
jgi:co-chaperonin GroES (HSP10)